MNRTNLYFDMGYLYRYQKIREYLEWRMYTRNKGYYLKRPYRRFINGRIDMVWISPELYKDLYWEYLDR